MPGLKVFPLLLLCATELLGAQAPPSWRVHDMTRPRPATVSPAGTAVPGSPPAGAVVLFDGSSLSHWVGADGNPARLARGEGLLLLDSWHNDTYADGQAGSMYGQHPPLFNVSRPAGAWQKYDVFFRHPRFDATGALLSPARVTVLQNGVPVQNNVELFGPTSWLSRRPGGVAHPSPSAWPSPERVRRRRGAASGQTDARCTDRCKGDQRASPASSSFANRVSFSFTRWPMPG